MQYAQTARAQIAAYAESAALACNIAVYTTESELLARAAENEKIDLLFSDINLGENEKNGIEVVKAFQRLQPLCQVVYLTGYLTFATEVYDTPHLYFVLKSELELRLPDVLKKAVVQQGRKPQRVLHFKKRGVEVQIAPEDIIYCEHHGRKTDIVTIHETIAVYQKVSDLMQLLDPNAFVRCHSSYIVHLRFAAKFQRTGFVMPGGQVIPVSRSNYAEARRKFSDFQNGIR